MNDVYYVIWDEGNKCATLLDSTGQTIREDHYADSTAEAVQALTPTNATAILLPAVVVEAAGDWLTG